MKRKQIYIGAAFMYLAALLTTSCEHSDQEVRVSSISGIAVSPGTVAQGGTVELIVTTVAVGDPTFLWSTSIGVLSDPQNDTTDWTAPDSPGAYVISVVVTDDLGTSVETVNVAVDTYIPAVDPHYLGVTNCVQCHSSMVSEWKETSHAEAIPTLAAIYQDNNPSCLPCHTVGYDPAIANGGYDEVPVERLANVQCENCHGPASNHNGNPAGIDISYDANTCGVCHEDEHHPYLEEWEESAHARSLTAAGGMVTTNNGCLKCHVSQAFVQFVKTGTTPTVEELGTNMDPLTCQTCHDPHSADQPHQLRIANVDLICGECHTSGSISDVNDPGSPHHPQWNMLHGTDGLEYAGETYEDSPHMFVVEGKCGACHVSMVSFSSAGPAKTGHTFEPELRACTTCHPSATDFNVNDVQTEITALLNQLHVELDAASVTDSLTVAFLQAQYNYGFVESDASHGVHNFKYAKKLLETSLANFTPTP